MWFNYPTRVLFASFSAIIILVGLLLSSVGATSGGVSQNTRQTSQNAYWNCDHSGGPACFRAIRAVALSPPSDGWAVGDNGTILQLTAGSWQSAYSPTTNNLYAVTLVSATEGWAVGDDGTILHLNGGKWQASATPTSANLHGLTLLPSGEGWAVGDKGTVLHLKNGIWSTVNRGTSVPFTRSP